MFFHFSLIVISIGCMRIYHCKYILKKLYWRKKFSFLLTMFNKIGLSSLYLPAVVDFCSAPKSVIFLPKLTRSANLSSANEPRRFSVSFFFSFSFILSFFSTVSTSSAAPHRISRGWSPRASWMKLRRTWDHKLWEKSQKKGERLLFLWKKGQIIS